MCIQGYGRWRSLVISNTNVIWGLWCWKGGPECDSSRGKSVWLLWNKMLLFPYVPVTLQCVQVSLLDLFSPLDINCHVPRLYLCSCCDVSFCSDIQGQCFYWCPHLSYESGSKLAIGNGIYPMLPSLHNRLKDDIILLAKKCHKRKLWATKESSEMGNKVQGAIK